MKPNLPKLLIPILVFALIFAVVILTKDKIVQQIAQKQLRAMFPSVQTSVENASVDFTNLSLKNIHIKNTTFPYQFNLQELKAKFSLSSLLKRKIEVFEINGLDININSPSKTYSDLLKNLQLKQGKSTTALSFEQIIVSGLKTKVNLKDLTTDLTLSLNLGLTPSYFKINQLLTQTNFTSFSGVEIKDLYLNFSPKNNQQQFTVKECKFNKATLQNLDSQVSMKEDEFSCNVLSAKIFNGQLSGRIWFHLKSLSFAANINVNHFDLEQFARDFELEKKVEMSGLFSGQITAQGENAKITELSGKLLSEAEGGKFFIKDETILNNLPISNQLQKEVLAEALKNYTFERGEISLNKEARDFMVSLLLDGEKKGKIEFPIVLHGVF